MFIERASRQIVRVVDEWMRTLAGVDLAALMRGAYQGNAWAPRDLTETSESYHRAYNSGRLLRRRGKVLYGGEVECAAGPKPGDVRVRNPER